MSQDQEKPLVSVWMITYNHEAFIAQAIESVLMQKTSFKYELVIGEDCSTDETATIVKKYSIQYPEIIRARFNVPNIGMTANMLKTLQECTGKYIAMLEGDDYWIDPLKLQKQVDILETTPHVASFHPVIKKGFRDNIIYEEKFGFEKKYIETKDILSEWKIATCSIIFKNGLIKELPEWIYYVKGPDHALQLILSQFGSFIKQEDSMGVYRIHDGGISNTHSTIDYIYNTVFTLYITNKECFNNEQSAYIEGLYLDKLTPILVEKADINNLTIKHLLTTKLSLKYIFKILILKIKLKIYSINKNQ